MLELENPPVWEDHIAVEDDGSTDGLSQKFVAWQKQSGVTASPVSFIQQQNQGAASARNAGLKAFPDADWYAFLDSDDLWPPDSLARCHKSISRGQHVVAATLAR
ncbi:glycosyltransferase family 2 protein [Myxococcota bacterium]|nr:glycosyltransferase family 2 protein [Myxococcota bacterium]